MQKCMHTHSCHGACYQTLGLYPPSFYLTIHWLQFTHCAKVIKMTCAVWPSYTCLSRQGHCKPWFRSFNVLPKHNEAFSFPIFANHGSSRQAVLNLTTATEPHNVSCWVSFAHTGRLSLPRLLKRIAAIVKLVNRFPNWISHRFCVSEGLQRGILGHCSGRKSETVYQGIQM